MNDHQSSVATQYYFALIGYNQKSEMHIHSQQKQVEPLKNIYTHFLYYNYLTRKV